MTRTARQARRLADHIIFPHMGELMEHGAAETIFTQPNDATTQAYIEGTSSQSYMS
jgi:phosphate transport system ATP-binding protein